MKKLYRVVFVAYVMAENAAEALREDIDLDGCNNVRTMPAALPDVVHDGWLDGIPFGSDDDRTCREILQG